MRLARRGRAGADNPQIFRGCEKIARKMPEEVADGNRHRPRGTGLSTRERDRPNRCLALTVARLALAHVVDQDGIYGVRPEDAFRSPGQALAHDRQVETAILHVTQPVKGVQFAEHGVAQRQLPELYVLDRQQMAQFDVEHQIDVQDDLSLADNGQDDGFELDEAALGDQPIPLLLDGGSCVFSGRLAQQEPPAGGPAEQQKNR